ncbi:MAG TPA: permease prefix domain 2-containing transporter [Bryobacteraceae bacterium]|nr:permease prefix domain 2-containing transporter [Bryobacteraceae bacterium]
MSQLLTPPAVPVAILNFFASQPDFPAVAGDISEEFQQRAQTSGPQAARRWYWHEAFRNASALTWRELMRTPVRTTLIAFGCFLAANLAIDLYAFLRYYPLPALSIFNDLRHKGLNYLVNFIAYVATGWIAGRLLRGREWAITLTFTVVSVCLVLPGMWFVFFETLNPFPPSWREFVIVGNLVRIGAFWLGSLGIRHLRIRQGRVIKPAPGAPRIAL